MVDYIPFIIAGFAGIVLGGGLMYYIKTKKFKKGVK